MILMIFTRIGLNTDDIQFGSFLKRFETAVYVWLPAGGSA